MGPLLLFILFIISSVCKLLLVIWSFVIIKNDFDFDTQIAA